MGRRPERQPHPAFAEFVQDRTIAVVGPAPLVGDQVAEIEAHDLVYVCSAQWRYHDVRADIVFLNSHHGRLWANDRLELGYEPAWVVLKNSITKRPNSRTARKLKGVNVNQVTGALYDLSWYAPRDVKVFGADFYLGGPSVAYTASYGPSRGDFQRAEEGIRAHDQHLQRAAVRDIIAEKGWPSGDARYTHAANLTDAEYSRQYQAAWRHPNAQAEWEAK